MNVFAVIWLVSEPTTTAGLTWDDISAPQLPRNVINTTADPATHVHCANGIDPTTHIFM